MVGLSKTNTVHTGDCLDILDHLPAEFVQAIYLDPPFFTQKQQTSHTLQGQAVSYEDSWASMPDYLAYLKKRIEKMLRTLKSDGLVFVHCDKHASHYIKVMLDDLLGYDCFINEIIWSYKKWSDAKKGLQNTHQTIFMYAKNKNFRFNTLYTDYSATTNIDQLLQHRVRDQVSNRSIYAETTAKEKQGVPLGDVWSIPFLNPRATERVTYPTQKPVELLEQIIKISTSEHDIILDPFCGSGTTLVAAKLLNRRYIGIDVSPLAVALANNRLLNPFKSPSQLLIKGEDSYVTKHEKHAILQEMSAKTVYRNTKVDGLLNTTKGLASIKILKMGDDVRQALTDLKEFTKTKGLRMSILVADSEESSVSFTEMNLADQGVSVVKKQENKGQLDLLLNSTQGDEPCLQVI